MALAALDCGGSISVVAVASLAVVMFPVIAVSCMPSPQGKGLTFSPPPMILFLIVTIGALLP